MTLGEPKDEYNSLNDNMRWYSNIRFAQLTLFVAMTAGLLTVIAPSDPPFSHTVTVVLKIGGCLTVIFFWIMEERAAEYWRHFMRRAVELEKELGYKQYSTRPQHKVNTTHVFRVFFSSMLLMWIATLIWR